MDRVQQIAFHNPIVVLLTFLSSEVKPRGLRSDKGKDIVSITFAALPMN
jgi:hypothetical protein